MPRFFISFVLILFIDQVSLGQSSTDNWLHPYWSASWITMPGKTGREYGVYHFRKNIDLPQAPAHFPIRVSADNRYRLYVNGKEVGYGPAQGAPQCWVYDSYDIGPLLQAGKNTVAATVWNYGEKGPWVQMSVKTAFLVQGETDQERIVNTDASWKAMEDTAYHVLPIDYSKVWEFIVVSPGDEINGNFHPWDWSTKDLNDSSWRAARFLVKAAPYSTGADMWWQLVPRMVPLLIEDTISFHSIRRSMPAPPAAYHDLLQRKKIILPPNTHTTLLFDQGYETTAFPELVTSGGKETSITLSYAESLMDSTHDKGNRNEVEGKELLGVSDRFLLDGGSRRHYCPLSFRAYRYVEMIVQTGSTAVTIEDFFGKYDHAPTRLAASFSSSDDTLNRILQTAWHTQEICTKDYLLTDAYYEQLQYVGDNRIQGLVLNSVGFDSALIKNTIWQYYQSLIPEGLTQSRFPVAVPQVMPTYSLLWISMLHDYAMYHMDPDFIQQMLPAVRRILDWYREHYNSKTGLLGPTPYFNYVDWTKEWVWDNDKAIGGVPMGGNSGGSAIITLQWAYTLQQAAILMRYQGDSATANAYTQFSTQLAKHVYNTCWDEKRKLLADTQDKTVFSQHANIFAVLAGAIPENQRASLIRRMAMDTSLIQSSVYFRFFLGEAYKKAGLAAEYQDLLTPWKKMLEEGLTTFAEVPGHARSDCHPWGCSPLYAFFATICGVRPLSPGFTDINIKPALGKLQWVRASMPVRHSFLKIDLRQTALNGIEGSVDVPPGMAFVSFTWKGKTRRLSPGLNSIHY